MGSIFFDCFEMTSSLKEFFAILLLCAGVTGYGQNTVIDTIYTENLACGGESFKLLWMPDFGFPEDEWANSLQNLLDQSGFLGASLLDYSYADLQSENCWCWYDPLSAVGSNSGVSCDCCGGETIRPFVDYLVVSIPTNPCAYLSNEISARICNGCTDPSALNFESHASQEDGSCIYSEQQCGDGTIWDETSQTCILDETYCSWQPDSDGDQLIGVSDLLMFLSVFGDTDLDQDGIFDSNDDCVGEYDECGVCNGSGPSIPVIESIEILYDSLYAEQIDEWFVFEVGVDTTFTLVCEVVEGCTDSSAVNFLAEANVDDGSCWLGCGFPLSYNDQSYSTALIAGDCWFTENLNTNVYANGDSIIRAEDNDLWASSSSGFYCRPSESLGAIYNGLAAVDERNVCPSSWHAATESEWNNVTSLYGSYVPDYPDGGFFCDAWNYLAIQGWMDGNNSSGLSVIESGIRYENGIWNHSHTCIRTTGRDYEFFNSNIANWCGSSEPDIVVNPLKMAKGGAIRCIKD